MEQIIVTGGAGYIGSHTVVELIESGYQPIIIDNFSNSEEFIIDNLNSLTGEKITLYTGDVRDKDLLERVFDENSNIIGAIHFAAYKSVGESVENPEKYYHNNIESTLTLLDFLIKHNVPNLVFSSSCTVYGEPDELPVTEKTPRKKAESPYGNTKKICEDIIEDTVTSGKNVKAIALRYFNPIGAHPSSKIGELPLGVPDNLVPFITQTAAGIRKKITVFGNKYNTPDGTCIRDYIHVCDLAKAHVKAIEYLKKQKSKPFYDVFNAGVGRGYSVMEVLKGFIFANGVEVAYEIGDKRPGDIEKIYADTSKSNKLLHWKAEKTLEDALIDAWNWQKSLK